jgi:hypothetical protein
MFKKKKYSPHRAALNLWKWCHCSGGKTVLLLFSFRASLQCMLVDTSRVITVLRSYVLLSLRSGLVSFNPAGGSCGRWCLVWQVRRARVTSAGEQLASPVPMRARAGPSVCRDQSSALIVGSCWNRLSTLVVSSCWDRPSAFAGIDRKLQVELC